MNKGDEPDHSNQSIWRIIAVYLGGAWVSIEAINFFVDKYDLSGDLIDAIIILLIGGLPILVIYSLSRGKFNLASIIGYLVILGITVSVISYNFNNPQTLNPTHLRLLKFRKDQKKVAESIRSMVILPFDNYTGKNELEYYVSGMHSALITDVGKISALRVISKTTSKAVSIHGKSISAIASDLGVDAVVEASVSCVGEDSVCIRIQLISAYPEEKQLWTQVYYEDKTQIQNLYNRISKKISEEIEVVLTPQEELLLADSGPVNKDAYDLYLKGLFYLDQISEESLETAAKYFKLAIEEEPNWGPPYAGLAGVGAYQQQMGFVAPPVIQPEIYKNVEAALRLDPNSASSYHTRAVMAVWTEWNWSKAERAFQRALELNPNDALTQMFYAHFLLILRKPKEAEKHFEVAIELDPLRPFILSLGSVVQQALGNYQYACELSKKALSIEENHYFSLRTLEGAYFNNKEYQESLDLLFSILQLDNDITLRSQDQVTTLEQYQVELARLVKKLEEIADSSGYVPPNNMIVFYLRLDDLDMAMKWMEKGYQMHDPGQPYITVNHIDCYKLQERSDYQAMLRKMNLPLHD